MWLAWSSFVVTWTAYLVTASLSAWRSGREALEVLGALAGASALFLVRAWLGGQSLHGALLSASLGALWLLVLTRGQPARLFDPKASVASRGSDDTFTFRRGRRIVHLHQAVFLLGVGAFFIAYALSGATFLD